MEDRALFPYFEAIKPENYPKLIVMEDGINSRWERDILSWLLANGYEITARTRGNVMLASTKWVEADLATWQAQSRPIIGSEQPAIQWTFLVNRCTAASPMPREALALMSFF